MSPQTFTRSGGHATGLPGATSFGLLSRRAAMLGAFSIASFGAPFSRPAAAQSALVGTVSSTSADVGLIALANRVVALARRCEAGAARRAALNDRVLATWPVPPDPPWPNGRSATVEDTAGGQVLTLRISPERDPAFAQWDRDREATWDAWRRGRRTMEQRIGLERAWSRGGRMRRRLSRWSSNLVAMRPTTAAGLAAVAEAALALIDDVASIEDGSPLVQSVLSDAVRLGTAGTA